MKTSSVAIAAGMALALPVLNAAHAAETAYPTKPIRLIAPFPAGGTSDILARMVGPKMTEAWGPQVIVDNRTGANGMIAYELGAKGNPDGYTILHATPSFALNTIVFSANDGVACNIV